MFRCLSSLFTKYHGDLRVYRNIVALDLSVQSFKGSKIFFCRVKGLPELLVSFLHALRSRYRIRHLDNNQFLSDHLWLMLELKDEADAYSLYNLIKIVEGKTKNRRWLLAKA